MRVKQVLYIIGTVALIALAFGWPVATPISAKFRQDPVIQGYLAFAIRFFPGVLLLTLIIQLVGWLARRRFGKVPRLVNVGQGLFYFGGILFLVWPFVPRVVRHFMSSYSVMSAEYRAFPATFPRSSMDARVMIFIIFITGVCIGMAFLLPWMMRLTVARDMSRNTYQSLRLMTFAFLFAPVVMPLIGYYAFGIQPYTLFLISHVLIVSLAGFLAIREIRLRRSAVPPPATAS